MQHSQSGKWRQIVPRQDLVSTDVQNFQFRKIELGNIKQTVVRQCECTNPPVVGYFEDFSLLSST